MRDENLDDADCAELARVLRRLIDADRYPLSPLVRRWRELVPKVDPATPVEPYSAPVAWVNSSIGQQKGRGSWRIAPRGLTKSEMPGQETE